eukprot:5337895-Pleurochrysis_carterae.AAC.4
MTKFWLVINDLLHNTVYAVLKRRCTSYYAHIAINHNMSTSCSYVLAILQQSCATIFCQILVSGQPGFPGKIIKVLYRQMRAGLPPARLSELSSSYHLK